MKKVVIVTGANRGLGASIAIELARSGAAVVLGARRPGSSAVIAAELGKLGAPPSEIQLDVCDYEQSRAAVESTLRTHGRIDAIVNNAGVVEPIGLLADTDPAEWSQAIVANLVGPYNLIHAVLPKFLAAGGGTIVNISTGAAAGPREGWSAYCSSKAGLAMLNRIVDLEYAGRHIKSFNLRPGMIDTDMQVQIRASGINDVSKVPREKLLPPSRPARIAAWLALMAPFDLVGRELAVADEGLYDRAASALAQLAAR